MPTRRLSKLSRAQRRRMPRLRQGSWCMLLTCLSVAAHAQQSAAPYAPFTPADGPLAVADSRLAPSLRPLGNVSGTVKDLTGALVPGAVVTITAGQPATTQTTESGSDGSFLLIGVSTGPYKLSVTAPGLDPWTTSGSLQQGKILDLSEIALALGPTNAQVTVRASKRDIAEAQLSLEEKQRVLGLIPNFYATYLSDAVPLTAGQKFRLAWRFSVDPAAFAMAGFIAGTEQSENSFSGYGQGARGYAKRFGATYADGFNSTLIGQAILPSIFHQDPRYFVKGTGSVSSRILYAIATTVICKGDNSRWQVNYSNILGNVASASLSNLYYPASSRHGAGLTLETSLITTASGAFGGLMQEFVLHRLTPHIPDYAAAKR